MIPYDPALGSNQALNPLAAALMGAAPAPPGILPTGIESGPGQGPGYRPPPGVLPTGINSGPGVQAPGYRPTGITSSPGAPAPGSIPLGAPTNQLGTQPSIPLAPPPSPPSGASIGAPAQYGGQTPNAYGLAAIGGAGTARPFGFGGLR